MGRKPGIAGDHDAHATRIAWWAAFFATVALIAALGAARSAQALTGAGAATAVATVAATSDSEAEAESEEELEGEECEAGEEGGEEECGEEDAAEVPEECVLSSASASVSASTASDKLRLAIHYTAFSPATVGVAYWLRGSKGPLSFGAEHEHFARKGVFHQTATLSEAQMAKAIAAKDFTVLLRPTGVPNYCHPYLDRHLTARHAAAGGLTWSEPASSLRG